MDKNTRVYIYAFLSRLFESEVDKKLLEDFKNNEDILDIIGEDAKRWILGNDNETILEALNIDFTSLFLMNQSQPLESSIVEDKDEVLAGLQNPVMQFYFQHGFDLNLQNTHIQTPDHISIEFGFMQNLSQREEKKASIDFLEAHLLQWVPSYLLSISEVADTPFYKDLCKSATEFIIADYESLLSES